MNKQKDLEGNDAEPWAGICCKACYYAKGEKCVCKCGGMHHGKGNPNYEIEKTRLRRKYKKIEPNDHYYPSAQKYRKLITDPKCHCGFDLSKETIWSYDHCDGWEVEETDALQWLWIECPKCHYQMSIWKLGVSREANILEDETV